jgi:ATP-dependent exoDNAse (exonuclease V) alpha subunit
MNAKALAIDEISMISADIFELLDLVLRKVRNNDQPFGGLQIILFGDFLQLPPVANFNNFKFAFDSYSWSELNLKYFNLREAFRSQNKNFTKLLDNLRIGELSQENKDDLLKRLNIKDENEAIKPTILTTHNYKVDKINEYFLKQIPEKEVVFEADYFGDKYKIEFLKKNSLAAQKLKLKLGAQVMMTKNTYQKEGIINGSLGIICGFTTRKSFPIVEFANGKKITIATSEWAIERFDEETQEVKVEAGVVQIPLILAWAITIHKSQGLTLDKISCDLSDIFSPGQAYVALSRARNLESIYLQSINFNKITAHQEAVNFYKNI